MSEILFKSFCFENNCNNKEIINWKHDTCSSSSHEYINDNAYIRCGECGRMWPLLMTKFNCSRHINFYSIGNTSLKKAINVVSSMIMCNEINYLFYTKIVENLKEQTKKFGLE